MNTEALMVMFKIGIYVVTGWCVGTMIGYAFDVLRDVIRQWRWNYKYKHRFDKPPIAKRYCKDYKLHSVYDDKCNNVTWADRHTPDDGFCYDAEPRKKDDDKANRC